MPATFTSSCATPWLSTSTSAIASPTQTPGTGNQTFVRILLNDAVYPVPSCQGGPGKSCLLSKYAETVKGKLESVGDLKERCNVTASGTPSSLQGASFFTNLEDIWVDVVGV